MTYFTVREEERDTSKNQCNYDIFSTHIHKKKENDGGREL